MYITSYHMYITLLPPLSTQNSITVTQK